MTALDLRSVRSWRPAVLGEAATLLHGHVRTMQIHVDRLPNAAHLAQGHWRGSAGQAALDRLSDESARGDEVTATLLRVVHALGEAEEQLTTVRTRLETLVADAIADGLLVHDSGRAEAPASLVDLAELLVPGPGGPDPGQLARQHTALITAALRQAVETDSEVALMLRNVRFTQPLEEEATAVQVIDPHDVDVPAAGADAATVAAWWRGLSTQERLALVTEQPARVADLGGVPVAVRDFANRLLLPGVIIDLQHRLAGLGAEPQRYQTTGDPRLRPRTTPAWRSWHAERGRLRQLIEGAETVAEVLDAPSQPPAYLIAFQPLVGNGRAVVAKGNPDTARHVATFVTGTATRLGGIGTDLNRSQRMFRAATRRGAREESLSSITWYGYDAPQTVLPDAADLAYAEKGAPLLDGFLSGLRATHQGEDRAHVTVVGHSYGSTVVGWAASHGHRLEADDVVMVASPGAGVGHGWLHTGTVDELHLAGGSRGHVYATRSISDPIHWVADSHLGADPVDDYFGAHVFDAPPTGGHSGYWAGSKNPALAAMGQVIAGHGSSVPTSISRADAAVSSIVPAL